MQNLDKNFLLSKTSFLINFYLDRFKTYPLVFLFKRNLGSWILMLKMMESHYGGVDDLNIEKLIDIIPRYLTSRVSLFNLINEAFNFIDSTILHLYSVRNMFIVR